METTQENEKMKEYEVVVVKTTREVRKVRAWNLDHAKSLLEINEAQGELLETKCVKKVVKRNREKDVSDNEAK